MESGMFLVFFFSSRRRHTRFDCDWSSDVCSSDLILAVAVLPMIVLSLVRVWKRQWARHRRIARPTFWIWLYVSITGVVVYWMLYHLAPTLTAPPVPPGSTPREVEVV